MLLPISKILSTSLVATATIPSNTAAILAATEGLINKAPNLLMLRGGGAAAAAAATAVSLNLSRESFLIQELATYGTLTALVMNAALRMWSTTFSKDQSTLVGYIFTISTALCIMTGAFTAILFQLLVIYSKSALSMGNDEGYMAFRVATAMYRKWGFRCFLTEISTFVFSFAICLYNKLWNDARVHPVEKPLFQRAGVYIMAGFIILMAIGAYEIKNILNLATNLIFIESFHDKFA
jgi:hypothetical protein